MFNILLQILEDGRLTDGKGRTVDFRNAVLVMTSNVGSSALFDLAGSDPERARKEAMEALRQAFRPEFINRIDDIVLFNPLGQEQLNKIIDLELAKVMRLLAERKVRIELTPAARERVVQDREARLKEFERELAEAEALMAAREQLVSAARKSTPRATIFAFRPCSRPRRRNTTGSTAFWRLGSAIAERTGRSTVCSSSCDLCS